MVADVILRVAGRGETLDVDALQQSCYRIFIGNLVGEGGNLITSAIHRSSLVLLDEGLVATRMVVVVMRRQTTHNVLRLDSEFGSSSGDSGYVVRIDKHRLAVYRGLEDVCVVVVAYGYRVDLHLACRRRGE